MLHKVWDQLSVDSFECWPNFILWMQAPASFGLVTYLLHDGLERSRIRRYLLIFSLAAPGLAIITFFGLSQKSKETLSNANATAFAMLFSAGTFLYVATIHVLSDLVRRSSGHSHSMTPSTDSGTDKGFTRCELLALVSGALLPLTLTTFHHHWIAILIGYTWWDIPIFFMHISLILGTCHCPCFLLVLCSATSLWTQFSSLWTRGAIQLYCTIWFEWRCPRTMGCPWPNSAYQISFEFLPWRLVQCSGCTTVRRTFDRPRGLSIAVT